MRPIKLEMQGFIAFREKSEIDFSSFDLFAITGPTGAGKTSLLDAMTYSLYGKTSRLNKAGKDLISQGAASMSVLFRFRAGSGEYKIARAIKGSSVTARLENPYISSRSYGFSSIVAIILRSGPNCGSFVTTLTSLAEDIKTSHWS